MSRNMFGVMVPPVYSEFHRTSTTTTASSATSTAATVTSTPANWDHRAWTIPASWGLLFFDAISFLLLILLIANGFLDWRLNVRTT